MLSGAPRAARILDRYVMHAEIASGGMASVHFGEVRGAAGFARPVAIKRLHPQFAKDPEFSAMFLDEAHLAARVRHPNVISVIDVVAGDDELFLVMEYVEGESLANLLRQAKTAATPPTPAIAVAIVLDALAGLHAAHEAENDEGEPLHIVHRDVSPQNLLVGEDGVTRVLDFGVARAAGRSHATREGQLKGKLRYMAPEQLLGELATRKSDVYAASVVLWEALTGERLFAADTDAAMYGKVLESAVPPPSRFAPVPPALDAVVLRGLHRNRDARFADAHHMATALAAALSPASAREVAAWVGWVAGHQLAARAARLKDSAGGVQSRRSSVRAPAVGAVSDDSTVRDKGDQSSPVLAASISARPRGRSGATRTDVASTTRGGRAASARRVVVFTAFVGALAGGALALRMRGATSQVLEARRGIAATGLLGSLAADRAGARAAAEPMPSSTEEAPVPAPPSSEPAIPTPYRSAPTSARSRCDPPYTIDAAGIRRVKRECL